MSTAEALPRWNMTVVYPGLDSQEFAQGFQAVITAITNLAVFFDTQQIAKQDIKTDDTTTLQTLESAIDRYNAVLDAAETLSSYSYCFVSTDSWDTVAQARLSELQQHTMRLSQLGTRFTAWIGSLDIEALIERSAIAHEHAYRLRRAKEQAAHLMTPAEEALASELNLSSGIAWEKLHGDVTSQLLVPLELDGRRQELPMSAVRALAYEADREVRRRAYEAELESWKGAALPLAAAMNGIKGEVNVLAKRRGWESPLEAALFDNTVDRQTLEAMFAAARASFSDFRRYLQTKARALGLARLAWYDLFAPLEIKSEDASAVKVWTYEEATRFIMEQFGTYSSRLADYAKRAFREHWIDAEPRPGKRDGAYCILLRKDESRIFANYKPSYNGVSTLAHELGHGYHNVNLAQRTALQRITPATLAETASIFCETIIRQAALQKASVPEQIAILEASLQGSCQVVVDITSRFLFEQRVFESRKQRELSIDELNNLMLAAQGETYGEGLDQPYLHPFMWAMKPHYYSSAQSYYNFPYMFGLLFGLGLYARYEQDPENFKTGYDELLSATGLADAATLASRFGIDIRTPDFWRASLEIIHRDIDRFEELIQLTGTSIQAGKRNASDEAM